MANLFITGNGKDVFVKKLMEFNSEIKSIEGIMVHIPEDVNIGQQEYLEILDSLSLKEEVQITKLYC